MNVLNAVKSVLADISSVNSPLSEHVHSVHDLNHNIFGGCSTFCFVSLFVCFFALKEK